MAETPHGPKDVADLLESLAQRIRDEPSLAPMAAGVGRGGTPVGPWSVPAELLDDRPALGEHDIVSDGERVTVTIEAPRADPKTVSVSLLAGRLLVGLGEGPGAPRRDYDLPELVDEDKAVATFRNGVLDVVLPIRRTAAHRP